MGNLYCAVKLSQGGLTFGFQITQIEMTITQPKASQSESPVRDFNDGFNMVILGSGRHFEAQARSPQGFCRMLS
ncbi:MAG: hypothetical protein ACJA2S_005430 [Cyclobacteriaceae bacterium]